MKKVSVPLLPGERVLMESALPWTRAELGITDMFRLALGVGIVLLLPVCLCVFMTSVVFFLTWLGVLGLGLLAEAVISVRRDLLRRRLVMVTTERVICVRYEDGESVCRIYPLRCLRIRAVGKKLWFHCEGDEPVPMLDVGDDAPERAKYLREVQKGLADAPASEPISDTHPLLPEGESLYMAGQSCRTVGVRTWLWAIFAAAFYLSVAVSGWLNPPETQIIWLSWGAQTVLLVCWLVDMIRSSVPEPFAIGRGGIYDRFNCWGVPPMNRPYAMVYHADGTVTAQFNIPLGMATLIHTMYHIRSSGDIEQVLRGIPERT